MENRLNLAQLLESHRSSESLALTGSTGNYTYAMLYQHISAARQELGQLGLRNGDRLALMMPNIPAMPIYYYAALSLGAIVVPLNPLLTEREVRYHLDDSGAQLLLAWDGARMMGQDPAALEGVKVIPISATASLTTSEESWESAATGAHDPAVLLYTSGTTGLPKGAILTHQNLWANATTVAKVFEYRADDTLFGGLPLFHSFGQTVSLNAAFAAGATVALLPRFSSDGAVQLCQEAQVSIIAAVPTMYTAMAAYLEKHPAEELRGKIRYGISGGSALAETTHADFERLLSCPILEGYGLSETAPVVSFNQPAFEPVMGSVGRPIEGVQVEVRNEQGAPLTPGERGQLWVSGPSVMAGYWQNEAASREVFDGSWFATGDIARLDEEGNIYIVDRLKDMILRNGYSVYPREIEDVLYRHEQVRQVAVVGKPDNRVGEEIWAFVVARESLDVAAGKTLCRELDALARKELASYKYPRYFKLVEQLPLGPTGKILKREL